MNYAVIMAGGSGKRLWPLSTRNTPKQIIPLFNGRSLLRLCFSRISDIFEPENILVVTNVDYAEGVKKELAELPPENVISEPVGRNTANAIGLAATVISKRDPDPESVMAVFSADQLIDPIEPLQIAIRKAIGFISDHPQALITFGIKPAWAHTGFGYVKRGEEIGSDGIFPVAEFKEKPNKHTASRYIRSGEYCWNSGMFVFRVNTILKHLDKNLPHNFERFKLISDHWGTPEQQSILEEEYEHLEHISIDYAVMERAERDIYVIELDCHWQDVGSYEALSENVCVDISDSNIKTDNAKVKILGSVNNMFLTNDPNHLIAAVHVEDMIIAHTPKATLICHRDETDLLKQLLEEIEEEGFTEFL